MDRRKILLRVLYWLAVLVVSIEVLIALILLLESRDSSSLSSGARIGAATPASPR